MNSLCLSTPLCRDCLCYKIEAAALPYACLHVAYPYSVCLRMAVPACLLLQNTLLCTTSTELPSFGPCPHQRPSTTQFSQTGYCHSCADPQNAVGWLYNGQLQASSLLAQDQRPCMHPSYTECRHQYKQTISPQLAFELLRLPSVVKPGP